MTGKPRADYTMVYGNAGSAILVLFGERDEMRVEFLHSRLVEVSAYRMLQHLGWHEEGGTGILLGPRDYGNGAEIRFPAIGSAFNRIFRCDPASSSEKARAEFEAANQVEP